MSVVRFHALFPPFFSVGSWYIAPITWHKDLRAQGMIGDGPPGLHFLSLHCVIVDTSCFLEGERLRSDPPPMLVVCTPNHPLFSPMLCHGQGKACVAILRCSGRSLVLIDPRAKKEQTMTTSPPPSCQHHSPKESSLYLPMIGFPTK